MQDLLIRKAEKEDFSALCDLFFYLFQQQHLGEPELFRKPDENDESERERLLSYLLDTLDKTNQVFLLAICGSVCLGFVHVLLHTSPESPTVPFRQVRCEGWIQHIVVLPDFQGAGIGQALVQAAKDWAHKEGATSVGLQVWGFNQGAVTFFEKLGHKVRTLMLFAP